MRSRSPWIELTACGVRQDGCMSPSEVDVLGARSIAASWRVGMQMTLSIVRAQTMCEARFH